VADLRLGMAIGGTRAEAVLMDQGDRVVGRAHTGRPRGEQAAMRAILRALIGGKGADPRRITDAVLSSATVLDAIERRRGLRRVAVLRVGAPLTLAVPPLATWPRPLRRAISAGEAVVGGGAEYDARMVAPFDADAAARFLATVAGVAEGVAVTSVFSPVAPEHELAAEEVVRRELGTSMRVSLSHELGTLGLLERENATVLNAALAGVVENLLESFSETLEEQQIDAEPSLAQGDGTVMTLEHAVRFPVYALGSGPASAIRGGAWLSGIVDGLTLDVDATGARIGTIVNGRPHERPTPSEIAGIRAGFRLPEVLTLPAATVANGALAAAVDAARRDSPTATLVVLGAAAALTAERLDAVGEVIVPVDAEHAEAVGLVVAPAGGQADRICVNRPSVRAMTIESTRAEALARAIHAGADPDRVQIIELEEIPLTYVPDPMVRVRAKAAGPRG
jgi:N-methylhydantoinase A/oxoprolinase/acetone carboxylase beta subunit